MHELEAGRRLLQIVLVGQPELQTRLKQFQMRQIEQRVTMRCELRPLSKEDVAGYVAHRLSMVGGTNERIAFASQAIEMIHAASNGVPRLVNVICDRALSRAHLERLSVIGPPLVVEAINELQLVSSLVSSHGLGAVVEKSTVKPWVPEPCRFQYPRAGGASGQTGLRAEGGSGIEAASSELDACWTCGHHAPANGKPSNQSGLGIRGAGVEVGVCEE